MHFAPLFEEERRQKMDMLKQIVKIMKDQTTTTTTTTTRTTTRKPARRTTRRPITTTTTVRQEPARRRTTTATETPRTTTTTQSTAELLGLPELPPQPTGNASPIFKIRVQPPRPKAIGSNFDHQDPPLDGEKWQLIPPVESSKSIVRFRVDPEQPILSLEPPPGPRTSSRNQDNPVSPFQLVGHVMSDAELKSFPDSPIVNIKHQSGARVNTQPSPMAKGDGVAAARLTSLGSPRGLAIQSIKRTGKSEENGLSLPVQLGPPGGGLPGPLVWISPASLARSPMVNLRRLTNNDVHSRPPNVERTLTMMFPGRQRRRFEKSCLRCLTNGGRCPHCLVVKK
jgi:hypothetical protein